MKQKTKRESSAHRKRHGLHQKDTKDFLQTYYPFLPLFLIVLVVISLFALRGPRTEKVGIVQDRSVNQVLSYATSMSADALLSTTNQYRATAGVGNLAINSKLNQAAQAKAEDMATRNYWSHDTPDGNPPWVFINNAGYSYSKAGENLACGFGDSGTLIEGWYDSPSHRDNLLETSYKDVGFGIVNSAGYKCGPFAASEQTIVVAMYGTPLIATEPPAPVASPIAPPATSPSVASGGPVKPENNSPKTQNVIITILNKDGTPSPGTKVTIYSQSQSNETNEKGIVIFKDITVGEHEVEVEIAGAKTYTKITLDGKSSDFEINLLKPELGSNKIANGKEKKEALPKSTALNRIELFAHQYSDWVLAFLVLITSAGISFNLIKHGVAAHKFFVKGEKYILTHKLVDVTVILLILALIYLTQSVGVVL